MTDDPDKTRGLYPKYRVEKNNGKPVGECFVLEEHDPHALPALETYRESVKDAFPDLAVDLAVMITRWDSKQSATDE